jgi:hypothetical protein
MPAVTAAVDVAAEFGGAADCNRTQSAELFVYDIRKMDGIIIWAWTKKSSKIPMKIARGNGWENPVGYPAGRGAVDAFSLKAISSRIAYDGLLPVPDPGPDLEPYDRALLGRKVPS